MSSNEQLTFRLTHHLVVARVSTFSCTKLLHHPAFFCAEHGEYCIRTHNESAPFQDVGFSAPDSPGPREIAPLEYGLVLLLRQTFCASQGRSA